MGTIVNEVYDEMYDDTKAKHPEYTSIELQRYALDYTFKKLNISKNDEWRNLLARNGYVMMWSPLLDESFYLCKDEMFDQLNGKFDEVVYKVSELEALKLLDKEDVKWMHEGKKLKGSILPQET
jgi:hypothetical protein